ncbi:MULTISPECIES: hypothetical protein [Streptomyces]|uniref:hypothetical protein n=1 Tax=Streptomyces TaxID=1883 RepID=UPI002DD9F39B|nr:MULTISPECIES: hypothetical protein [unclassified Streptomyces]WSD95713.1 hypothetical protein OG758_17190 [Streptomyces sp. NBC_01474]
MAQAAATSMISVSSDSLTYALRRLSPSGRPADGEAGMGEAGVGEAFPERSYPARTPPERG